MQKYYTQTEIQNIVHGYLSPSALNQHQMQNVFQTHTIDVEQQQFLQNNGNITQTNQLSKKTNSKYQKRQQGEPRVDNNIQKKILQIIEEVINKYFSGMHERMEIYASHRSTIFYKYLVMGQFQAKNQLQSFMDKFQIVKEIVVKKFNEDSHYSNSNKKVLIAKQKINHLNKNFQKMIKYQHTKILHEKKGQQIILNQRKQLNLI